jgi:hypothetical protein
MMLKTSKLTKEVTLTNKKVACSTTPNRKVALENCPHFIRVAGDFHEILHLTPKIIESAKGQRYPPLCATEAVGQTKPVPIDFISNPDA